MDKPSDEPCCSKSNSSSTKENEDPWLIGVGRNAVLHIKCSAMEEAPENPPAHRLHMTYKTHQAETKLLNVLLSAHGMREVRFQDSMSIMTKRQASRYLT